MKIKGLRLKNGYKRFYDLTIDLGEKPKRIIALVGPNGCGKSSVLDGMLYCNNAYENVGAKASKGPDYHSMNQQPNFNSENVDIQFDIKGTFYEIRNARRVSGLQNTIFSFRSPYRYNSNLKVQETRTTTDIKLNKYGATVSSDLDDKMEENYRRLYVKFNKYMNETDSKPSEAKTKIIGDLNGSLKNCLDLEITSIGSIESGEGTLYFTKADHPKPFEFNVLSSGEKEVVDILLDLYLRQDEYDDTVFLIDEPELHVNTSIQKKLLLEINKSVGKDCQIWIATHSIGFLRALQSELKEECDVIYFKKGVKWASDPQVLEPMKKTRANWSEIFETALDDLTGLISPKRIVYCEGKYNPGTGSTEKGMDAIVFNNIFNEKHHDTLFVSSGGNTELDQRSGVALAIMTKVFSDIEILVFKDRDVSSGRTNSLADRQIYLDTNPPNHRMMKRWEIENYLFDKEVLKSYCYSIGHTFNEAEYDKVVTDIDNQDVKALVNHIRNFCGITISINPDSFKIKLSEHIKEEMDVYKELEECIFGKQI